MSSSRNRALESVRCRIPLRIFAIPYVLLTSVLATATETVTMGMATQVIDLDSGTVSDSVSLDPINANGADVKLAYNADRIPHAAVVPVGDDVEMAFVAGVGYDGVSLSDIASLTFSAAPLDSPFTASDCVVVRTDLGTYFKLGNAIESGLSITLNYEQL